MIKILIKKELGEQSSHRICMLSSASLLTTVFFMNILAPIIEA
jgi:hypothetical protein